MRNFLRIMGGSVGLTSKTTSWLNSRLKLTNEPFSLWRNSEQRFEEQIVGHPCRRHHQPDCILGACFGFTSSVNSTVGSCD